MAEPAEKFEITIRGNPSDKVPLVFENKDHEQHFDKLREMKVLPCLSAFNFPPFRASPWPSALRAARE